MNLRFKRVLRLFAKELARVLVLSVLSSAVLAKSADEIRTAGAWYKYNDTAMTTRIELEFWFENTEQADALAKQVFKIFHEIDQRMNRYDPNSELSLLNRVAAKEPLQVSPSLFEVLLEASRISRLSDGAFDISFGSAGFLYDYRKKVKPGERALVEAAESIDYRKIMLDSSSGTVALMDDRMVLDLGGIAKGYAVDKGAGALVRHGVKYARLSAGGDMRLIGDKLGNPWVVGVQDPRNEGEQAVLLPLADVAVSTSGDYERFFIDDDGKRVHHILSPKTGKPVNGVQSVTVIGSQATETDALSTAVFVLGVVDGLALINSLPRIDVVIVDAQRKLHFSEGLMPPAE
jgi:thiamine biosynthesis lipoprotein